MYLPGRGLSLDGVGTTGACGGGGGAFVGRGMIGRGSASARLGTACTAVVGFGANFKLILGADDGGGLVVVFGCAAATELELGGGGSATFTTCRFFSACALLVGLIAAFRLLPGRGSDRSSAVTAGPPADGAAVAEDSSLLAFLFRPAARPGVVLRLIWSLIGLLRFSSRRHLLASLYLKCRVRLWSLSTLHKLDNKL